MHLLRHRRRCVTTCIYCSGIFLSQHHQDASQGTTRITLYTCCCQCSNYDTAVGASPHVISAVAFSLRHRRRCVTTCIKLQWHFFLSQHHQAAFQGTTRITYYTCRCRCWNYDTAVGASPHAFHCSGIFLSQHHQDASQGTTRITLYTCRCQCWNYDTAVGASPHAFYCSGIFLSQHHQDASQGTTRIT